MRGRFETFTRTLAASTLLLGSTACDLVSSPPQPTPIPITPLNLFTASTRTPLPSEVVTPTPIDMFHFSEPDFNKADLVIVDAGLDALETDLYTGEFFSTVRNLWTNGSGSIRRIALPNGQEINVYFHPKTEVAKVPGSSANTETKWATMPENGKDELYIDVQGNFEPGVNDAFPQGVQAELREIDYGHETAITIGLIAFTNSSLRRIGFDPSKSLQDQGYNRATFMQFSPQLTYLRTHANGFVESSAQLYNAFKLFPIVDSDLARGVMYTQAMHTDGSAAIVPTIGGIPLGDDRLYVIDSLMGPTIRKYSSYEALAGQYRNLTDIPGYMDYLDNTVRAFPPQTK